MILFNFTGLDRFYLLPKFDGGYEDVWLWFGSVRWVGVEVTVYSAKMGRMVIRRFNFALRAYENTDGRN